MEKKSIQSNPISFVTEGLMRKRNAGESRNPDSVDVLKDKPIEKIPSIPSKLDLQDLQYNLLGAKVESPSLSLSSQTPDLSAGSSLVAVSGSFATHGTEPSPIQTIAHTGLTQELEGLKLSDNYVIKGFAEDDLLNVDNNYLSSDIKSRR